MASQTLISLPKELLRQICGRLPSQAALDFILVCRCIYEACDDWTVWRDVIYRSKSYPRGVPVSATDRRDVWKRYTIADAKARGFSGPWELSDLRMWLLQLATVSHSLVLQSETLSLERLVDLTLDRGSHSPPSSGPVLPGTNNGLETSATKESDTESWTLAQAAAFCLAVNQFSYRDKHNASIDYSRKLVQWAATTAPDPSDPEGEARGNLVVKKQHAIANLAVGSMCARLKSVYATRPPIMGVCEPPSAFTIPFSQLMKLPLPFATGALDDFSKCHLSATTDPDFLTSGDWTGSYHTLGSSPNSFNPIGGPHHDGFDHPPRSAPPGFFPYGRSFEGVVRFHRIGDADGTTIRLESNNFHSKATLHKLRVEVNSRTGQLAITHWHPMQDYYMTTEGVMTPFGIVSRMHVSQDSWLWLWKVEWSTAQH